jgi:hypothetical protein
VVPAVCNVWLRAWMSDKVKRLVPRSPTYLSCISSPPIQIPSGRRPNLPQAATFIYPAPAPTYHIHAGTNFPRATHTKPWKNSTSARSWMFTSPISMAVIDGRWWRDVYCLMQTVCETVPWVHGVGDRGRGVEGKTPRAGAWAARIVL